MNNFYKICYDFSKRPFSKRERRLIKRRLVKFLFKFIDSLILQKTSLGLNKVEVLIDPFFFRYIELNYIWQGFFVVPFCQNSVYDCTSYIMIDWSVSPNYVI